MNKLGILAAVVSIAIVVGCFVTIPCYNVWQQKMSRKAEFAKTEQGRKIRVEEAETNLEAEKLSTRAEIEHAKGTTEAIKVENGNITPAYT